MPPPSIRELDPQIARLSRFRAVLRGLVVTRSLAWLLAAVVGVLLAAGLADFALRTPASLRMALLAAGLGAAGWLAWRAIGLAWRFRPSLADLALRLERGAGTLGTAAGSAATGARNRNTGRDGVMASGVELARDAARNPLAGPVITAAAQRLASTSMLGALRPKRTLAAVAAAGATILAAGLLWSATPRLFAIGAERLLLPWTGAAWPKRTAIAHADHPAVHPLGRALPLRAALLRSSRDADRTNVEAVYRLIDADGKAGPERRVQLVSQNRPVAARPQDAQQLAAGGEPTTGTLMERLVEPAALEVDAAAQSVRPAQIAFFFRSDDDQTPEQRMELVRPPAIRSAAVTIAPPDYARRAGLPTMGPMDLGQGADERARVAGVLSGSRVQLTIELNKPVPVPLPSDRALPGSPSPATPGQSTPPAPRVEGPELAPWLARAMPGLVTTGPDGQSQTPEGLWATFEQGGARWVISWMAATSVRTAVRPVDQFGLGAESESVYRVETVADRAPEATITQPAEDVEALPTASVPIRAEGRDDVGLASVAIQRQSAKKAAGSVGAAPEPAGQFEPVGTPATWTGAAPPSGEGTAPETAPKSLAVQATLDLAAINAKAGDEFWITALASDVFEQAGVAREPTRSRPRRIRVISPEQLVEQAWAELGAVRRTAMRLSEQQGPLRERTDAGRDTPTDAREQAQIGDASQRQQQTVSRLRERLENNGLRESELEGVMQQASSLLQQAREGATQADEAMRRAQDARQRAESAQRPGEGDRRTEDARRQDLRQAEQDAQMAASQARQSQRRAQDALDAVAELLDKGQDAWSARRGLERLVQDQKSLRQETARAGQETVGKNADELTQAQRERADQLAERQRDLGKKAQEAVQRLGEKAEQMKDQDAAQAAAMREAAERGDRAQLQQRMEQIANQIQQNRQQSAQQNQDAAIRQMEEMLQQMQQAQRNREAVLVRELASLIEAIRALVARQQRELEGVQQQMFDGADGRQISIRNATLASSEKARAAGRETREVANLLDAAGTSQAEAVAALRKRPADAALTEQGMTNALARLREALEKAEAAQQQAQRQAAQKARAELRRAYKDLLDEQTDLRRRADEAGKIDSARRRAAAARDLADPQLALRKRAAQIEQRTAEIAQTEMFAFAHRRLDAAMARAAEKLGAGEAGPAVALQQTTTIRVLSQLIEALGEEQARPDDFRENPQDQNQQGGNQGGGNQQDRAIPPAAEVKLLRDMQKEALELTRLAADAGDPAAAKEAGDLVEKLQAELFDRASALLKKLEEQAGASTRGQRGNRGDAPPPAPAQDPAPGNPPDGEKP